MIVFVSDLKIAEENNMPSPDHNDDDSIMYDSPFTSDDEQAPFTSDDEQVPVTKHPALDKVSSPFVQDVAEVIGSPSISCSTRHSLLNNYFQPPAYYSFPKDQTGRSFQHQWLQRIPWLVYSKQENGGFCLPCVLFAQVGYHGCSPGVLVNRALTNFKKALETIRRHADKEYHKASMVKAGEFQKTMSGEQPNIQQRLSKNLADTISINCQKLSSIVKTIILCGRQNIALRGHRDNALDVERDVDSTTNHGNFLALLNFRIDAGDTVLENHLSSAARNATYTSNTIQNQIVTVLSDQVINHIVEKVRSAKWYTVIADEVTDVANREQLTIVLRYVDSTTYVVREDLVGFFECDLGISGLHLATKITSTLKELGLDLSYLRGQSYDGAGNMAGSVKGTAALIRKDFPLAIYVHCASHCLNLAVVKSLQVTSVRNMVGVVGKVYHFLAAHPKRQRAFEAAISQRQPSSSSQKLKDMCRTRWIQRIDAVVVFKKLHLSIVDCLENISNDGAALWSSDSLTDARCLLLTITTTDFVSAVVITHACLMYVQALTATLQAEAKDIVKAVSEIENVTAAIQSVRDNIDTYHTQWFLTITDMLSKVGKEPLLPRRCGRQTHRSNTPADTPSEYFCRTISIPVLDHLLSELSSRFGNHKKQHC